MPIVNTNTGKVLVADKELVKKAKGFVASMSSKELQSAIEVLQKEGEK